MKLRYSLPIKHDDGIKLKSDFVASINIAGVEIDWILNKEQRLEEVFICFPGIELDIHDNVLETIYPDIQKRAHKIASYIANRFFIQVGIDAISFENTAFLSSPQIFAESNEERVLLRKCGRRTKTLVSTMRKVVSPFSPGGYEANFPDSVAFSYFADAMRVHSPFVQFELYYKVIEYYFERNRQVNDLEVSEHASPINNEFCKEVCQNLRETRNKCAHPRASKGHINPENIEDVAEIESILPRVRKLAHLLLFNPPRIVAHQCAPCQTLR